MKIFKLSLFTFLTCVVMSCSTDPIFSEEENLVAITTNVTENQDSETTTTSIADADLLGTWIGVDVSYTMSITTVIDGVTTSQDIQSLNYSGDYSITFSENPSVITAEGLYSIEEEIIDTDGNTFTNTIRNLNLITAFTEWDLIDDELTIDSSGKIKNAIVLENTPNTLILAIEENTNTTINGVSETSIKNSVFTFMK